MKPLVLLSFVLFSIAPFVKCDDLNSNLLTLNDSSTDETLLPSGGSLPALPKSPFMSRSFRSFARIVNVVAVIDTESLMRDHPYPSQNPDQPTGIHHDYSFLITPRKYVEDQNTQGKAELHIKVNTGDIIRWYGTSETVNFENTVIVYNLRYTSGQDKLSSPQRHQLEGSCVYPDLKNISQVVHSNCNHITIESTVYKAGSVFYEVHFAVYKRSRDSSGKKVLHGYFSWDPTITIRL